MNKSEFTDFWEDLLIQKVKPLVESNETLLDDVADQNEHGPRAYSISTAMGAQIREIIRDIEGEIYAEDNTETPSNDAERDFSG